MFKLIILCLLIYLNYALSAYFNFIGIAKSCINEYEIMCSVLFIPSGYFVIKNNCLLNLLSQTKGLIIIFQNNTFTIDFINRDKNISFLYPNILNSSQILSVDYITNNTFIKFKKYNNYSVSNMNIVGFINEVYVDINTTNSNFNIDPKLGQLFLYEKKNSSIIFPEIDIFPKENKTIYIDYKNHTECKKNNLIVYDLELYDDSCMITYV